MSSDSPVLAVPQEFAAASSFQVRDELGGYLSRDLLGPWEGPEEWLPVGVRGPRDRYLVGALGPKHVPLSVVDAASDVPDTEAGADADGDGGELRELFTVQNAGRMWASSAGLSFAVDADVDVLSVTVSWGHYAPVPRGGEDGKRRNVWVRRPVTHTVEVRLDGALNRRFLLANPGPSADDEAEPASPVYAVEEVAADDDIVGVYLNAQVRHRRDAGGRQRRVVELALVNTQYEALANPDTAWLFQPSLEVTALDGVTDVFLPADDPLVDPAPAGDDPEERHLRLLYRDLLKYADGRNVAVHADARPGARRAWRLVTRWMPTFDVPATVAPPPDESAHLAGVELSMDRLAELDPTGLAAALTPLAAGYTAWLDERAAQVAGLPPDLREVAQAAIGRARVVAERVAAGVALLVDDPQALDAFRFANAAMALQRRRTALAALREISGLGFAEAAHQIEERGASAASWRPFQLAFVLLNLPALTDPAHPQRRADSGGSLVDLLFFPTGGGKTEAYLGLTAYTFAIRRLHGVIGAGGDARDGGDGVGVLMRYTLRLLTAQQFQRAAALVCAAEVLRQRAVDGRFGDKPFRIGLWVGASVAPNWYPDAAEQIDEARVSGSGRRVNVLQTLACPWCGEKLRGERDLDHSKQQRRVRLYCPRGEGSAACEFSRRINPDGLPILTVDEELYRYPPSLVIATVDKLAQLPWFGFAGNLFGRVRQWCPRHGYRHPDLDRRTDCRDKHNVSSDGRLAAVRSQPVNRLRPPDLIIQDELHLISGALGTTVGLFEGAVAELCRWEPPGASAAAGPVIVASTATTKRADAQVRALYGRRLAVFPPPVLDVADTFFSRQVPLSTENPGRRYLGLCAHGTRLKSTEIRLAEILLIAGQTLFDQYGEKADPYLTLVGYFNATRELAGMRRYLDDDVANRVRRNGVRRGIANRIARNRGLLNIQELTSRISSGDIADVLKQLEYGFDPRTDTTTRWAAVVDEMRAAQHDKREPVLPARAGGFPVDVVLATSMLQVGVDVSRFGLMVVTGQPKNTAEYIQASSRVGRDANRPGLVVTLYNWSRPRDLAHYEDFAHYHATFYRQVEALSVTPYARRSLDRGTAATVVTALRHAADDLTANPGAGRVDLDGELAAQITGRLLDRAERAGGPPAREYLAERLGRLRDAWTQRQGGEYPLGYELRRDPEQTYVGLLDLAGQGPWGDLTVARSMRETETEVNLLVSGGDLVDRPVGAPPWQFQAAAQPADTDDGSGDELGAVPTGRAARP
ncbi:DISARM system helicase DrmA [Pilimelia columellifera]|uniref:DISARM system helicase DrmA n=1 Tax=Pilimelia columellifera TaxID=706574 RepID=UPI0031D2751C